MSRLTNELHPLLTEEVLQALRSKQIFTAMDFVRTETQQLVSLGRLNFREVLAVRNFLLKKFSARPVNGLDCYRQSVRNTAIIPTGMQSVDDLLQGGLVTGNIYEICGLPASGKTQFVLTAIKNLVQTTQQPVYVLDTKNDFSATRFKHMLRTLNKERQTQCLARILVNRTHTKYDVINVLYDVKRQLEGDLKLRLIVIDSLPSIMLDSSDFSRNNSYLNHLVNVMRYIAVEHHVVFLVTNLIRTWEDNESKEGPMEHIACGKYWYSVPNTRLKIERLSGDLCQIKILGSDTLMEKSVDAILT